MNWYKKSQEYAPIAITSYFPGTGELGISFNGGKIYKYIDINSFTYDKIYKLLKVKNYKTVNSILRTISEKNKKNEEENREEILNELYERGYLQLKVNL